MARTLAFDPQRRLGAGLCAAGTLLALLTSLTGSTTPPAAGLLVAAGFALLAIGLRLARLTPYASVVALLLMLYIGVSAWLAADSPSRDAADSGAPLDALRRLRLVEIIDHGPSISRDAFDRTLRLGTVSGLLLLAAILVVVHGTDLASRRTVLSEIRLTQAASILTGAGVLGMVLALARAVVSTRHGGSINHTLWHGGAYLLLVAQSAIVGLGLHLSLRLRQGAPPRRLAVPLAGLAVLVAASSASGERQFLLESGVVVTAALVAHRRWARFALGPVAVCAILALTVTQAARDGSHDKGGLTMSGLEHHLAPDRWSQLLSEQFQSFQFATDVEAYGDQIHASNPFVSLLSKPIPRQLDPGKAEGFSEQFTKAIYPSAAAQGVSVAVPLYAELEYATGSAVGVAAFVVLFGLLLGWGFARIEAWPLAAGAVGGAGLLWSTLALIRGDLSNSIPEVAAWIVPIAFTWWWSRSVRPRRIVLDALAVPPTYSGVGEIVRQIGASLTASPEALSVPLIVRCAADARHVLEAAFPPGTTFHHPLASSRPSHRRFAYQLAIAPWRDGPRTLLLSASEIAAPWGLARRVVTIFDLRYSSPDAAAQARTGRALRLLLGWIRSRADTILTASAETERALRADRHVHCPVHVVATHADLELRELASAGNDRGPVAVLSAVRSYKGADVLLNALSALDPASRPAVEWIGAVEMSDDEFAALSQRAAACGLEFTGWLATDELQQRLDHASVLLAPSRYEGYGLALLEGLRRGLPVLASDIATHQEVAGSGALFFPAGDALALAQLLGDFTAGRLDVASLRAASSARAGELASANGSWTQALTMLVECSRAG